MRNTLEASPFFQPIAWTIVISGALFTGFLSWNAYGQIQTLTEKTLITEAALSTQ